MHTGEVTPHLFAIGTLFEAGGGHQQAERSHGKTSHSNTTKEGDKEKEMSTQLQPSSCARLVDIVRNRSTPAEYHEWLKLPLEQAVAAGEVKLTTELMRAGAAGDAMLMAVQHGQLALAEHLLLQHLVALGDGTYLPPACVLGHEPVVSLLLKHGADPSDSDTEGLSCLSLAARGGHVGVVVALLSDTRVDVAARADDDDGKSALDLAAIGGHADIISVIAERRPEVIDSKAESSGLAALHYAAKEDAVLSINALVNAGANVEVEDARGFTPLHVAARSNSEGALLALLRHGADKESRTIHDETPLLLAIEKGQHGTAIALMVAGADVNCQGGQIPYSALERTVRSQQFDLVRPLLQHGASTNASSPAETSPLHWAGWLNSASAINCLVEAGANLEATNFSGSTPFHFAAGNAGNLAAIDALARHGANVNAEESSTGNTPLHIAARNCAFEPSWASVDALLKAGADETKPNSQHQTPLDVLDATIEMGQFAMSDYVELTRITLVNAPRDRADRAWCRRALFVMCRAYPDRVRLTDVFNDPAASPASKVAAGAGGKEVSSEGEDASSPHGGSTGSSRDFKGAMGSLIGLQVDGVFRTIMKFL